MKRAATQRVYTTPPSRLRFAAGFTGIPAMPPSQAKYYYAAADASFRRRRRSTHAIIFAMADRFHALLYFHDFDTMTMRRADAETCRRRAFRQREKLHATTTISQYHRFSRSHLLL